MKFDVGEGIGNAIMVGIVGGLASLLIGGLFAGADMRESIRFWLSIWWLWVPVGLLFGLERSSK